MVVFWKDHHERFVFSHEASYCPILELKSGAGMCNQFFEGNLGDAELFNNPGRKERNSFVDIIQQRPRPRLGSLDLFLREHERRQPGPACAEPRTTSPIPTGWSSAKMSYESLMPDETIGYSTQPVELFGVLPVGSLFKDLFHRDATHGDSHIHAVLDLYGDRRYDVFWSENGQVRRSGDDATLAAISRSAGCALVLPFKEKLLFAVFGPASWFPGGEEPVDRSLHAGGRGGLRLGRRALGSLADRLVELADIVLEAGLALRLQLRLGRPVLRP